MLKKNQIHFIYRAGIIGSIFLIAAGLMAIFVIGRGISWYEPATPEAMVHGTASKPYVYRTLLPTTVRVINAAIPSGSRESIRQSMLNRNVINEFVREHQWNPQYLIEYSIAIVLMFLSLVGFAFAIRYFFRSVFEASDRFTDLATIIALLGLPPLFVYFDYVYDFTTLFLISLGFALMVRRKWQLYLPVFFIACINKETTILLTMVFAIHFFSTKRMARALFGKLLLIQLGIFVAIRLLLMYQFRNNPGGAVEFHLIDKNFQLLLESYSLTTALTWFIVGLLIFYDWPQRPVFLKHGLWIAVPLLITTMFFGFLDELRDYYEVYPIVILLIAQTVGAIIGSDVKSRIESSANAEAIAAE